MLVRTALLLAAALLFGTAIGVVLDHGTLAFWLAAAAGFLGSWGCCPLSQPLLQRHKALSANAGEAAGAPRLHTDAP